MKRSLIRNSIFLQLALLLSVAGVVHSQTVEDGRVLKPPRTGLVTLIWPDLSKLEEGVRLQISTHQDSLITTLKVPTTSDQAMSDAYGKLGEIYHAYSLFSPARSCYLNANHLSPAEFRWIYLLAKLDQQEGNFDEAIRGYNAALKLQPNYTPALVNLGNIFLELNRLEDAAETFKAALAITENNPATLYGLGQVALSQRKYSEAVAHFEKALAQTPGANRIHYSLAMAYRGLGDTNETRAHLAQQGTVGVRVSDPVFDGLLELISGERVHLNRGKLAFEARRYDEAAVEFRKAVASKPDSVPARVNLGAALVQTGDVSGAIEQFGEAIRIDPQNANAHYNLAILLANQNKSEQAIEHLRSALRVNAKDLSARFLLGRELLKLERLDEALEEFRLVVEGDPGNEQALMEQVKLQYRKRQFKQAIEALENGHKQYPQRGRTILLLAYMLATSPQSELRDGTRALQLAQYVYKATSAAEHGALIPLSLAELGRCREAAESQRHVIAAAEEQHKTELAARLKSDLKRYDSKGSCRPESDELLTRMPFTTN